MISLELVKEWMKLDGDEYDSMAQELLESASVEELEPSPVNKIAILYCMAYLFEHREDADHNQLKINLRALLESERKAAF